MAKKPTSKTKRSTARRKSGARKKLPFAQRFSKWFWRAFWAVPVFFVLWVGAISVLNPPATIYMTSESGRLGGVKWQWVDFEDIAPEMAASVVAAEDANFCLHWGFDMAALRQAIEDGGQRGASTISQQVTKNVFLWHGQTRGQKYIRKALEAVLTPVVELLWTKRRVLEVYLNVAEFDEGVFGVQAAARHYFGVSAGQLSTLQAARLAAILPNPKDRSASNPGAFTRKRTSDIVDGAATILADGRAECFAG